MLIFSVSFQFYLCHKRLPAWAINLSATLLLFTSRLHASRVLLWETVPLPPSRHRFFLFCFVFCALVRVSLCVRVCYLG